VNRAAAALLLALASCGGGTTTRPIRLDAPPLVLATLQQADVADGRGRFREIYGAVLGERDVEPLLQRMAKEPPPSGRPVHLGPARMKLRILVVTGLLGDIIAPWVMPFAHGLVRLEGLGYRTGYLRVSGRASCAYNAMTLRDSLRAIRFADDERVVLVGYSKGTPDILEALVRFPEVRDRTAAVLSVVGAVGGSIAAEEASEFMRSLFRNFPIYYAYPGDGGGIASLEPTERQLWMASNELPGSVRYFSLGAFTERENISAVIRSSYDTLAKIDPRNDSQVVYYDQVIPGSTLLGFANGDHWAIGLPFDRNMPVVASTLVTRNDYPREELIEAAVRFVEEALLADQES
jgi:hypothetical protein